MNVAVLQNPATWKKPRALHKKPHKTGEKHAGLETL